MISVISVLVVVKESYCFFEAYSKRIPGAQIRTNRLLNQHRSSLPETKASKSRFNERLNQIVRKSIKVHKGFRKWCGAFSLRDEIRGEVSGRVCFFLRVSCYQCHNRFRSMGNGRMSIKRSTLWPNSLFPLLRGAQGEISCHFYSSIEEKTSGYKRYTHTGTCTLSTARPKLSTLHIRGHPSCPRWPRCSRSLRRDFAERETHGTKYVCTCPDYLVRARTQIKCRLTPWVELETGTVRVLTTGKT